MYDLNKKFIFTHPIKCGGTSLEELFGFLRLREKHPNVHIFKHASLQQHFEELKNKNVNLDSFFKFSIIRNPWDRAVSFYHHKKYQAYKAWQKMYPEKELPEYVEDARNMTFKEFIFKYGKHNFNSDVSTKPFMFFENKFCMDYVIRLENLQEDFLKLKPRLQIDTDELIPHRNNSDIYLKRKHCTEYYDIETKEFIEKQFEWDIKTFNYQFGSTNNKQQR
jgi:chondroitin 4-sulfotransferase 11